jgi:type II secretory pathway pseudopilin PulG
MNRTVYGVAVVFIAVLLIVSSISAYYYYQDQQEVSENQRYVSELGAALASYRTLAGSFNSSLSDYNATLALLATAVANLNTSTPAYQSASVELASLWSAYQRLASSNGERAPVYQVDMLVDYGNGTRVWYNDSGSQPGWNAYVATLVVMNGSVQATWYPQYGEHLITGIGGVADTQTVFWFLLTYNQTASWQVAQDGADDIPMFNGTTLAWVYCAENASYGPACTLP